MLKNGIKFLTWSNLNHFFSYKIQTFFFRICAKWQFHERKTSFEEKKNQVLGTLGKIEFPLKRTKKKPAPPQNQVDEGLLETNFDLKAVTTSSFEMKFLDCPQPYPKVSK